MRKLLWLAVLLALVLLPLGAYVRLSQAGLGCPDWPGCYGQLSPAHAAAAIERAMQLQPDGPVSPDKAWKEMAHRYLAAALGVLLFCLWWQAWRQAQRLAMASLLLLVLLLQAMLGMLTVTLQLRPWVVTSHLLLGMSLFALLLAAARRAQPRVAVLPAHGRLVTLLLLLVLGRLPWGAGWRPIMRHWPARVSRAAMVNGGRTCSSPSHRLLGHGRLGHRSRYRRPRWWRCIGCTGWGPCCCCACSAAWWGACGATRYCAAASVCLCCWPDCSCCWAC